MSYEKIRYPLFWFSVVLNTAAVIFCSFMLGRTVVTMGFFNPIAAIQALCVAANVYWLSKAPKNYRRMKQLDSTIGLLDQLIVELNQIEAERKGEVVTIVFNREPKSPAEVFRDPPKFSDEE